MKSALRAALLLLLCLTFNLPLLAAPGKLTAIGPFGHLDSVVDRLRFPGNDPKHILLTKGNESFQTRDGGANWRSMLANFPEIWASHLEVVPGNPDHWYVSDYNGKVWQTRDAGATFTTIPLPIASNSRPLIFLDAARPQTLVLGLYDFITPRHFYSLDQGQNFTEVIHPNPSFVNPRLLGVDRGVLWYQSYKYDIATGTFTGHPDQELHIPSRLKFGNKLFFDRTRADTLYLAVGNYLYRSTNGGRTFETSNGQLGGVRDLIQSPTNPSHLAITGNGFHTSVDRGATWVRHWDLGPVFAAAFDPATGEILVSTWAGELKRFRPDGTLSPPIGTSGLNGLYIEEVTVRGDHTYTIDNLSRIYYRGRDGRWEQRGTVGLWDSSFSFIRCMDGSTLLISPADPNYLVAACFSGIAVSHDGGWTWDETLERTLLGDDYYFHPPTLALAGDDPAAPLYVLGRSEAGKLYRSMDLGTTWESIGTTVLKGIAVHPDPAQGLVGLGADGKIHRYKPATGWVEEAALPTRVQHFPYDDVAFGHHPAHPDLIYAIIGAAISRSLDFGRTWEIVHEITTAPLYTADKGEILINPFDANHWLLPSSGFRSLDGGRTVERYTFAEYYMSFDPLTPGRLLAGTVGNGVLEQTASLPACPSSDVAWCARGGRYLLTVDWKDPGGNRGRATQVITGSEDSGIFYFFDPNNWELMVKVLDGCAINQRQWLFAAGTTDVQYELKVEDRWTGQIRHYFNPAGQAAPAVTDIDAFSGCGTAAPSADAQPALTQPALTQPAQAQPALTPSTQALAATGPSSLSLVSGRFEAKTRWTNFAGVQGDGLTASLSNDNSGLFYFFSPDNWEVLVKVLDGCAINNHYWVLAAATTNVGYDLTIRDTSGTASKTYRNPVGRAAPATIDIEAFVCR